MIHHLRSSTSHFWLFCWPGSNPTFLMPYIAWHNEKSSNHPLIHLSAYLGDWYIHVVSYESCDMNLMWNFLAYRTSATLWASLSRKKQKRVYWWMWPSNEVKAHAEGVWTLSQSSIALEERRRLYVPLLDAVCSEKGEVHGEWDGCPNSWATSLE